MAKYSALILIVTLAVFWSSAEARYNAYQNDVIESMTNWAIEEMRDVPEPYHSRIVNKLKEAKNRQWDNVGEYFKHIQRVMLDFVSEMLRSKRSINEDSNIIEAVQHVHNAFAPY